MSGKFLLGVVFSSTFYFTGYIVVNKCIYKKEENSITMGGDKLKSIINIEHQKLISDLCKIRWY
jgi:predicted nucleic-acid-binding Zn-ribbon protein